MSFERAMIHPGLEALQDGFCMTDRDGRVTYWNPAAERLLDLPRDEALGRSLADVVASRDLENWSERIGAQPATESPLEFVEPLPSSLGGRHLFVRATPLPNGGRSVHFRDATAEQQLAERHSRLLEAIRDGFVAADEDGRIIYINRIAARLLGLPRRKALAVPIWSLVPPEVAEVETSLRATLRDGRLRRLRGVRPSVATEDSERVFDLWIYPFPGGGVSVLFQDTTERVNREKELARYAAEVEEANRAKSRFFAAVSHELRTPLNAIVGYMHLLSTGTYGTIPAEGQRAADRACVCAEHLARLIDDVLLMTTVDMGSLPIRPAPVMIEEFLHHTTEPLRQQAEAKGLRFSVDAAPDTPTVETDGARLRQLLIAVVSNAVKFTQRGEVRIEARALLTNGGSSSTAGSGSAPTAEWIEIAVKDSGPGISPEDRDRIFNAFEKLGDPSRSDSMTLGSGLGLTLARQLSVALEGELTFEERPGGGSVFRLRLPLRWNGGAADAEHSAPQT